ncbi:MAG: ComF family protein [Akkermansiaceae bacterium]|nr:ComF family protein [Armatimonadota bacterium]
MIRCAPRVSDDCYRDVIQHPVKTYLARSGNGLLDLIYPPMCLVCGDRTETGTLCERCVASFLPIPEPCCRVCGRPREGENCGTCARFAEETGKSFAFDGACASAVYAGALRHAVHLLKYREKERLGPPLGAFLTNRLVVDGLLPDPKSVEVLVAVPMHPSRERWRGYNQARLLAEPVAELLAVPLLPNGTVVRTRKTTQQVGLTDRARRSNVTPDAFAVPDPSAVSGKRILLVDDVFTTGATASACADVLKRAGASYVQVASLAAGG